MINLNHGATFILDDLVFNTCDLALLFNFVIIFIDLNIMHPYKATGFFNDKKGAKKTNSDIKVKELVNQCPCGYQSSSNVPKRPPDSNCAVTDDQLGGGNHREEMTQQLLPIVRFC